MMIKAICILFCLISISSIALCGTPQNGYNIANANPWTSSNPYSSTTRSWDCHQPYYTCPSMGGNQINQNLNQNAFALGGLGSGGLIWLPQNGINIANANGGNNQISQNLNQNVLGVGGLGSGGFIWLPQNGINIANANGGNNQINQNLNQNAFALGGLGSGGLVWIPQNGINIANANGFNNNINQQMNQNAMGF